MQERNMPHLHKVIDKTLFCWSSKEKAELQQISERLSNYYFLHFTCLEVIAEKKKKTGIHVYKEAEREFNP